MVRINTFDDDSMRDIALAVRRLELQVRNVQAQVEMAQFAATHPEDTLVVRATEAIPAYNPTLEVAAHGKCRVWAAANSGKLRQTDRHIEVYNLSSAPILEGARLRVERHYQSNLWIFADSPADTFAIVEIRSDSESASPGDRIELPDGQCVYSARILNYENSDGPCDEPSAAGDNIWLINVAWPNPGYLLNLSQHRARLIGTYDPNPSGPSEGEGASDERPLYEVVWYPPGEPMVNVQIAGSGSEGEADGDLVDPDHGCYFAGTLKAVATNPCDALTGDTAIWIVNKATDAPEQLRKGKVYWAQRIGEHDPNPSNEETSDNRPVYEIKHEDPSILISATGCDTEETPDPDGATLSHLHFGAGLDVEQLETDDTEPAPIPGAFRVTVGINFQNTDCSGEPSGEPIKVSSLLELGNGLHIENNGAGSQDCTRKLSLKLEDAFEGTTEEEYRPGCDVPVRIKKETDSETGCVKYRLFIRAEDWPGYSAGLTTMALEIDNSGSDPCFDVSESEDC